MSDVRSKPFKPMTDGSYVVPVELTFNVSGADVVITDKSGEPIGDACAALHFAALKAIGGKIVEARNTDAYERKPRDPDKVPNQQGQKTAVESANESEP
jgi:hypothetical protein